MDLGSPLTGSAIIEVTNVVVDTTPAQALLSLSNVDVTQAVDNFTISDLGQIGIGNPGSSSNALALVQGKEAVILATLNASNVTPGDQTPVTVTAIIPGASPVSVTSIPISSIPAGGMPIVIGPFPINAAPGKYTITVTPSATNATAQPPTDDGSNGLETVKINKTNALSIDYFSMSYVSAGSTLPSVSETVSLGDFSTHVTNSNQLFVGMYPIAENGLDSHVGLPLTSNSPSIFQGANAVKADIGLLAYEGTKINPNGQAAIGIVSSNYFSDRGLPQSLGVTEPITSSCNNKITKGALVTAGSYSTTPHEVGHIFGIDDLLYGQTVDGFWVDQMISILGVPDLMNSPFVPGPAYPYRWPSATDYACFYIQLENTNIDPQVLLVAGSIDKSQKVTLMPLTYLPNGVATPSSPSSDGQIKLLDSSGNLVGQASFVSNYSLTFEDGTTTAVNTTNFIAQIPFTQSVATINIQQANKSVLNIEPNGELLVSAIKNIAPTSFLQTPDRGERELLDQAAQISSLMKNCVRKKNNPWETRCDDIAVVLLVNLREDVEHKLDDSQTLTSADQVLKSYVLNVIDMITLNAIPNLSVRAEKGNLLIQMLPFCDKKDSVFTIASVTQGKNGSVSIERNGAIEYKPDSTARLADQFTVTLQDPERDVVTKTISILPAK